MLSLENLRAVFEFSPIPSLILFPNESTYTIAYINPAFRNLTTIDNQTIQDLGIYNFIRSIEKPSAPWLSDAEQNAGLFYLPGNKIYPIKNDKSEILYFVYSPEGFCNFSSGKSILKPFSVRNLNEGNLSLNDVILNSGHYKEYNNEGFTNIPLTSKPKADLLIMEDLLKRYKFLIQEGSDLIAILDKNGNYMYVGPSTKSILSFSPDFFITKNAFSFVHEDDVERVTQAFTLLPEKGRIKIAPFRFVTGTGKFKWLESVVTDLTNDPAIGGFVANSRDVTQEIEQEIKIKESVDRFNILSKATSDAVYDWNFLSDEMIWNKGIEGIFGYKQQKEFRIDWWYDRVHPEDVDRIWKALNLNIARKRIRSTAEYRFKCANGKYKYVLDRSFLVYNNDGSIIRIIGSLQDVTDKVAYIKNIEAQNSRLMEISWMQSHVVRAPLARLMALAELIKDEFDKGHEMIKYFEDSARELDTIIRNIIKKAENM